MKKVFLALIIGSIAIAPVWAMDVPDQTALNEELVIAAQKGNLAQVRELIAKGADARYVPTKIPFTTALMEAVRESDNSDDRVAIVNLLIKHGAKINEVEPQSGATALTFAMGLGTPAMVKALIDAGANLEHRNKQGQTVLVDAVTNNRQDVMQWILEAITKLSEQEKKSVISWLRANKSMQVQGKTYLPRDPRSLVTNNIIESLAHELRQRAISAGVQDALIVAQASNNEDLALQLRQYLDLTFLRNFVISKSKISRK